MKWHRSVGIVYCVLLGAFALALGCGRKEAAPKEPTYKPDGPPKTKLAVKLAKWEPFPGGAELVVPERLGRFKEGTGEIITRLFVSAETVLTNDDIVGTSFTSRPDQPDWGAVQIFLTPAGRERLARTSREHPGSSLAVFLGDKLELVPTITSELPGGVAEVTGWFRGTEGTDLAQRLAGR